MNSPASSRSDVPSEAVDSPSRAAARAGWRRAGRRAAVALLGLPLLAHANFFERSAGKFQTLEREVEYRTDLPKDTTIGAVLARKDGWVAQSTTPLPRTRDPLELWARFELPAPAESRQIMISTSPWERAEFFVVHGGRVVDRQLTGTLVPTAERTTRVAMTPLFSHSGYVTVQCEAGERLDIFARLASTQEYQPIRWLRFYLWDARAVRAGERNDLLFQGAYIGVILVLVIYNFGLFVTLRERSYLYYVAMELGSGALWAIVFGLTSTYVWPNSPALDYGVPWIIFGATFCAAIWFLRCYLDTAAIMPRADTFLRWLGLASLAVGPVALLLTQQHFVLGLLLLLLPEQIGLVAAVVVTVMALRKGHAAARHFLIAILFSIAGILVLLGASTGVLPATDLTLAGAQIGSAGMGIILSVGLGFRLRQAKVDLEAKQLEEARRLSAHEREKRELIEAQSHELERKVQERTVELAAAREKAEGLLANILPQAVIEELKAKGVTEPRRHEEVSILFTDFSGFTETVATIPAKRLVQELDEIFRAFDEIAAQHGLEKIKTIGDAYMAAAGLPTPAADHAARCVRAGLALTRFIEIRNETSAIKWNLRVGVHSGAVVAGVVGKNKYAYDVWGDTVNLASRLESAAERNRVNISAYTYDLVRDQFDCEYRSKLAAKGKGEIDMYLVRAEKTAVVR
ncbi:MAG TPA: adenylate/guanylate cyclase domain-containing protein [Opitutus sp.]|nr:adenylate/guanylate cyclase domain-containing protein [Opitutus sp.]